MKTASNNRCPVNGPHWFFLLTITAWFGHLIPPPQECRVSGRSSAAETEGFVSDIIRSPIRTALQPALARLLQPSFVQLSGMDCINNTGHGISLSAFWDWFSNCNISKPRLMSCTRMASLNWHSCIRPAGLRVGFWWTQHFFWGVSSLLLALLAISTWSNFLLLLKSLSSFQNLASWQLCPHTFCFERTPFPIKNTMVYSAASAEKSKLGFNFTLLIEFLIGQTSGTFEHIFALKTILYLMMNLFYACLDCVHILKQEDM